MAFFFKVSVVLWATPNPPLNSIFETCTRALIGRYSPVSASTWITGNSLEPEYFGLDALSGVYVTNATFSGAFSLAPTYYYLALAAATIRPAGGCLNFEDNIAKLRLLGSSFSYFFPLCSGSSY